MNALILREILKVLVPEIIALVRETRDTKTANARIVGRALRRGVELWHDRQAEKAGKGIKQ